MAFGLYQACVPSSEAADLTLTLRWNDNASNEDGFKVYFRDNPQEQFSVIQVIRVPDTEEYVVTLTANGGESFQFVVSAFNEWLGAEQESGFSNIATYDVPVRPTPPSAPSAATVILTSIE